MMQMIPAVLSTTEEEYNKDLSRLEKTNLFKWVHIDFMDNKFVPNKGIEASVVSKYPTDLHKEAHPMVLHPLAWVDKLVKAGFERIIFHIESADDALQCIEYIKSKGLEAGVAINNETALPKLEPFIDKIDVVLVMSIIPGFQGQKFIPASLDKIKEIYHLRLKKDLYFRIGIDGAVKDDNIKEITEAGVDFVIVGSFLLKGDIEENLERLWEALR